MNGCIVIPLSSELRAFTCAEAASMLHTDDGLCYVGQMPTDNNGFYDWLRHSNDQIVGVRWTAFDDSAYRLVSSAISGLASTIKWDSNRQSFVLFFSGLEDYEESLSCDQWFGANNLYSVNHQFAMSFSLEGVESLSEFHGMSICHGVNQ